ncbi:hypothetical protein AY601_2159 [Pedobacter cryoconitis]|uniref:Uncharacterized protein n=1 Tax=Pedobacter cryoconitis TaxID=188932 RepID=A0A127VCW0_9SPHI|nr:hypothetical protein [Pedobacter cryoconitis]AMP99060.1 hypothetical protein AY601_2159 [Pedobacter cryoconitis]
MKKNHLGGTFLLQYDALIDPRYQALLKALPKNKFEIGAWWELPQQLIEKAGIIQVFKLLKYSGHLIQELSRLNLKRKR